MNDDDDIGRIMTWERKQPDVLCAIIFILCAMLILKILLSFFDANLTLTEGAENMFFSVWPLIGIYTGIKFLRDDKWGFGGILFHLFILYCGIYYLALSITDIVTILSHAMEILPIIVDFATSSLGWLGFFMYYD